MSEPSKEAVALAEACLDGRELRDGIAAALQKLMDERDAAIARAEGEEANAVRAEAEAKSRERFGQRMAHGSAMYQSRATKLQQACEAAEARNLELRDEVARKTELLGRYVQRAEAAEGRIDARELACDEAIAEERRHREAAEAERDAIMCASNNQAARILELETSHRVVLETLRSLVEDCDNRGLDAAGILNALDSFLHVHEHPRR